LLEDRRTAVVAVLKKKVMLSVMNKNYDGRCNAGKQIKGKRKRTKSLSMANERKLSANLRPTLMGNSFWARSTAIQGQGSDVHFHMLGLFGYGSRS
jgi:hypothetical protein